MRKLEINRYDIKELIGQGGMSVVYRALDTDLKREVAVKVLHDFLANQADARKRFQREAVAVAQLKHRGIVEIFDYSGAESEEAYIVTELIEGPTLRDYVDDLGQIKHPEVGAMLTLKLADALAHAHEHGVIHRDLKPENIMVNSDGELKLMDFGIAQINGGPRLTLTGTLLGSPAHMAPEIIDGQRSDERADIFSLGTILYWLTTGKLPFEANNPSALFKRILDGEYDHPQMIEPKIGNGLSKIIEKTLEPDREARFPNVQALIDALKEDLKPLQLELPEVVSREFLTHPISYNEKLADDLVSRLTELGKQAVKEKHLGRAMDCFNRVLALEPQNKEVHQAMKRILRQRGWTKRLKKTSIAAGISIIAVAGGLGISNYTSTAKPGAKITKETNKAKSPKPKPVSSVKIPAKLARAEKVKEQGIQTPVKKKKKKKKPRLTNSNMSSPAKPVPIPQPKPPAEVQPEQAIPASIELKIGNSFADVYLDGKRIHKDFIAGTISLSEGQHKLQIVKPGSGSYLPRTLLAKTDGKVYEVTPEGKELPIRGALLFAIPRKTDSSLPDNWTASSRQ